MSYYRLPDFWNIILQHCGNIDCYSTHFNHIDSAIFSKGWSYLKQDYVQLLCHYSYIVSTLVYNEIWSAPKNFNVNMINKANIIIYHCVIKCIYIKCIRNSNCINWSDRRGNPFKTRKYFKTEGYLKKWLIIQTLVVNVLGMAMYWIT